MCGGIEGDDRATGNGHLVNFPAKGSQGIMMIMIMVTNIQGVSEKTLFKDFYTPGTD